MRVSKQLNNHILKVPSDYRELDTYSLFDKLGLYSIKKSGYLFYLPLGEQIFNKLKFLLKKFASSLGFEEIHQPILIPFELIRNRESIEEFYKEIYFTNDEKYAISPTTEDLSLELLENNLLSHKQLPIKWFSFQDVIRNIQRPEKILKTKQIRCLSMISFSSAEEMPYILKDFEINFDNLLSNLNIKFEKDYDFKKGIEYLYPSKFGEKKINNKNFTSLAMVYPYKKRNAIYYISKDNQKIETSVLTFGIGLQRILFSIIDSNRTNESINFPEEVRPFEYSVILHKGEQQLAERCYSFLKAKNKDVYIDDRDLNFKDKIDYADFLGVPYKIIIGKNSSNSKLEIKISKDITMYKTLEELI